MSGNNLSVKVLSSFKISLFSIIDQMNKNYPENTKEDVKKADLYKKAEDLAENFKNNFFIDDGQYIKPFHVCYDKGHNMFNVFTKDNGSSVYGQHKCSRCGEIENFQYDF